MLLVRSVPRQRQACCSKGDDKCSDEVDDHNSIEHLLERAHLVLVPSQILDQLRFYACVDYQGDDTARVLNVGASVKELVELEVLEDILSGHKRPQFSIKGIETFLRWDAVNCQLGFAFILFRSDECLKIFANSLVGQLGLQVALTVECSCRNERLRLLIFNLKKDAVSRNLFPVIHLDDVANLELSECRLFPLH